jgi:hypothetical protein
MTSFDSFAGARQYDDPGLIAGKAASFAWYLIRLHVRAPATIS